MRLQTQDPTGKLGAAALPLPAKLAQAYQSARIVHGSPGTEAIPAPRPGGVPQDWSVRISGSASAPNVWYPGLYYERGPLEHAPVSVLSDNQLPVPAVDPRGRPAVMSTPPTFLGQYQVAAVKVAPVYPAR